MTRHKPKPARTRAAPRACPGAPGIGRRTSSMTSAIAAEALTGVLSTPVVYVHDQVVYLVGGCEITTDSSIHWYQHGPNLADGSDKFTPIEIGRASCRERV